jgi:cyclohexanecarboxyl-CoA dehydrogenase
MCWSGEEHELAGGVPGAADLVGLRGMLRDVSGYQIGDGTPQIQTIIIARDVFGRDALAG